MTDEEFFVVEVSKENTGEPGVLSLRSVIARYGWEGTIQNNLSGRFATYTLENWRESDIDTTFLMVGFRWNDLTKANTRFNGPPGALKRFVADNNPVKRVAFRTT